MNPMDNPTYPAVAHAMAERNELMRMAVQRAVTAADNGAPHDPVYIAWARQFVANVKPLNRPLGTGEPS